MIIYGTNSKQLTQELRPEKCTHCGTPNSVYLYVYQKYAHIFWIPFFPIGKTAASQCSHCKEVLQKKNLPSSLMMAYDQLKGDLKTPVWTYSGLAIVGALVVFGVITSQQKDRRNAAWILAPHPGDILEVKNENHQYTLLRVYDVKGDSAFLQANNFETNQPSGLRDLKMKGDAAYAEEVMPVPTASLKEMLDKGEIIDIQRQ